MWVVTPETDKSLADMTHVSTALGNGSSRRNPGQDDVQIFSRVRRRVCLRFRDPLVSPR